MISLRYRVILLGVACSGDARATPPSSPRWKKWGNFLDRVDDENSDDGGGGGATQTRGPNPFSTLADIAGAQSQHDSMHFDVSDALAVFQTTNGLQLKVGWACKQLPLVAFLLGMGRQGVASWLGFGVPCYATDAAPPPLPAGLREAAAFCVRNAQHAPRAASSAPVIGQPAVPRAAPPCCARGKLN